MTRLQKDVVRELAVAILYVLTHQLIISLAGLGVFGLAVLWQEWRAA